MSANRKTAAGHFDGDVAAETGTARLADLAQAAGANHVLWVEWQGSDRHLHQVVTVPVRFHHTGLGVARDSFQQVSDLMHHHVGQDGGYLPGSASARLEAVKQHDTNAPCA